jgi:hypothetical protein
MTKDDNSITLSINRWHKIRGRLVDEMKTSRSKALTLGGLSIQNPTGSRAQLDSIAAATSEATVALHRFEALTMAIAQIKRSVADHSTDISARLADLDGYNAQIFLLTEIINAADNINNVQVEDLAAVAMQSKPQEVGRFSLHTLTQIAVMNSEERVALREALSRLKKAAFVLQEDIASLNQKKVAVVFQTEVSKAVVEEVIGS